MTVIEVLKAAREAAMEIRRIEEQSELMRLSIGVQGHSYDVHSKSGILDPSRKIDELLTWEQEKIDTEDLRSPIDEAWVLIMGASHVSDSLAIEVMTRYYLQAESYVEIARDLSDNRHIESLRSLNRKEQIKVLTTTMDVAVGQWEQIGIAHLREMAQA